jgi:beta-lactamase superfamily II metal-dependent hydrolase
MKDPGTASKDLSTDWPLVGDAETVGSVSLVAADKRHSGELVDMHDKGASASSAGPFLGGLHVDNYGTVVHL